MIRTFATLAVGAAGLTVCPGDVSALDMPAGANLVSERVSQLDSYAIPIGPFADQTVPDLVVEGRIERSTWRVRGTATTLQLLAPLRAQLEADGFQVLFECANVKCGGFDFRFGTEVVPAPDMHVDIRDFRFLSAMRDADEALTLLVSRNRTIAYVQMIRVTPEGLVPDAADVIAPPAPDETASQAGVVAPSLSDQLVAQGHIVLKDLEFVSGANRLGAGPYASLTALADFLAASPDSRIALVGHTDNIGALDANIALSKRRAEAVRTRLIENHDVAATRVEAQGMGFLSPVASNLSLEGREQNRRVEAILLAN